MARDIIENHEYRAREVPSEYRTKKEEELLNEKIRDLEKKNPELDLT